MRSIKKHTTQLTHCLRLVRCCYRNLRLLALSSPSLQQCDDISLAIFPGPIQCSLSSLQMPSTHAHFVEFKHIPYLWCSSVLCHQPAGLVLWLYDHGSWPELEQSIRPAANMHSSIQDAKIKINAITGTAVTKGKTYQMTYIVRYVDFQPIVNQQSLHYIGMTFVARGCESCLSILSNK